MSASLRKQDLPPAGGYSPIPFKRIGAKKYFNGYAMIGMYLGVTAVSLGLYGYTYYVRSREDIEARSARFAILPLLAAERDRAVLKQLRRNRDAETDLMKNVPGWEVGTLYGEPIYKTIPEDSIWLPTDSEYYVHADMKEWTKRFTIHQVIQ